MESLRICWFEDNRIDSSDRRKSTEHEWGDVTLWKFNENTQYFSLHCYTASISMLFNNCWSFERRMARYHWSNLYWDVPQLRPWQNSPCTCRLPRNPQDVKSMRHTSGALPLATTLKCEFVARTMSLSSCEPLAGTAHLEAASGEPSSGRHNNKLIGSRPSVPCFCNESLLSNSSAPAGCRVQAGRVQAGTKQLHPT